MCEFGNPITENGYVDPLMLSESSELSDDRCELSDVSWPSDLIEEIDAERCEMSDVSWPPSELVDEIDAERCEMSDSDA